MPSRFGGVAVEEEEQKPTASRFGGIPIDQPIKPEENPDPDPDPEKGFFSRAADWAKKDIMDTVGTFEALGTIGSGIVAEPIAGLSGLATQLATVSPTEVGKSIWEGTKEGLETPPDQMKRMVEDAKDGVYPRYAGFNVFGPLKGLVEGLFESGDNEAATAVIDAVRKSATYEPRTDEGKEAIAGVGEAMKPIGEALEGAEKATGDWVLDKTGSPALAALATTGPTILADLAGAGLVKGGVTATKAIGKKAKQMKLEKELTRSIDEAVPSVDDIFETSRQVYKEIDDVGATVDPEKFAKMVDKTKKAAHQHLQKP